LVGSSAPAIPVVCGPTAAGKTRLALWLAERADVTIVSADSRQLYRGFDIGTAKPTPAERRAVPHCGVDVLDPTQRASAAWWADRADEWIREALAQGRAPLVVGGTGLYLRALFASLFEEPPLDDERRVSL
jgi:tRNA dimethylallyltransferase